MTIVCHYRREKPRPWTPKALTRIVRKVCEDYGPQRTEQAFKEGFCSPETECTRIVNKVLATIAGTAVAFEVLALLEEFAQIRIIGFFLKRTALGKALNTLLAALRLSLPNFTAHARELEYLETQLRTWLRTGGKIWLERPPIELPPP